MKIPLFFFTLFDEIQRLFGTPQCPKCKAVQSTYEICHSCSESLDFNPTCSSDLVEKLPVWQLFNWNRRIQRIWYGVKFYQRYGNLFLIEIAFKQALSNRKAFEMKRPIWVVHPPFKANRPNLFAPFLLPLCQAQDWQYIPDAIAFCNTSENIAPLHHSQSILERQKLIQNRFGLNPSFIETLNVQKTMPAIVIVDDFITTGTTLKACKDLLQEALAPLLKLENPNQNVYDKMEFPEDYLQAIVITAVPKTSTIYSCI